MLKLCEADEGWKAESATLTPKLKVVSPVAAGGVPTILPERRLNPFGKDPEAIDQEYGGMPPLA